MIRVLPHKQINPVLWDACIHASKNGNIFGLYDSISAACKEWTGFIYGDYEAVLALPVKKKLGITYSWHPQFMGPLGVFQKAGSPVITAALYKEMIRHSWWIKMYYWEYEKIKGLTAGEKKYQELILEGQGIEEVRKKYSENTLRSIKKAAKKQLVITSPENSGSLVANMFRQEKGKEIDNLDDDSFKLLNKLILHFEKKGQGHTSLVHDQEGNLLAAGFFLGWKDTVIYYKGAVTPEGKQTGAMHYLIDHEISRVAGKFTRFDFGGSNVETVARFYKSFGGEDHYYYFLQYKKIG